MTESFSEALEADIVNDYILLLNEVFMGDATLQYIQSTMTLSLN